MGLPFSFTPLCMRTKFKTRGRKPLSTKMKSGFFPNTSKKRLHAPRTFLNSIKKIRMDKVKIASPVV